MEKTIADQTRETAKNLHDLLENLAKHIERLEAELAELKAKHGNE
jgi:hypothetical protein